LTMMMMKLDFVSRDLEILVGNCTSSNLTCDRVDILANNSHLDVPSH